MQEYRRLMRNQSNCKCNQKNLEGSTPFNFEGIGNQEMINYLFGSQCEDKDDSNKAESLTEKLINSVEVASGVSMEDTSVHFNSDRPEKIGALAYTQGRHIYVGKGQEKYLPHEMWHAAQQKQRRVETNETIGGFAANIDPKLEAEADSFAESFQRGTTMRNIPNQKSSLASSTVLQGKFSYSKEDSEEQTETGGTKTGFIIGALGALTKKFKRATYLDQLPQFSLETIDRLEPFFVDMIPVKRGEVRTKGEIFQEFKEILTNRQKVDFISWARENGQYLLLQYVEQLFDHDNLDEDIPVLRMVLDEGVFKGCIEKELRLGKDDLKKLEVPSELMDIRKQTSLSIAPRASKVKKQDTMEENWRKANKIMLEKVQQPGIPDAQEFLNMLVILQKDVCKEDPSWDTMLAIGRRIFTRCAIVADKRIIDSLLAMGADFHYYTKGSDTYNEVKEGIFEEGVLKFSDGERYKYSLDLLPGMIRKSYSVSGKGDEGDELTESQKHFLRSLSQKPLTDEQLKKVSNDMAFPLLPGVFVLKNLKQIFSWLSEELREIQTMEDPDKRLHRAILAATKLFVALISVHPFRDGNGRTCRMMADYVLLKCGYVPSAKIPVGTLTFPKGGDSRVSDAPKEKKLLKFYEEIANGMQKSAELLHAKEEE